MPSEINYRGHKRKKEPLDRINRIFMTYLRNQMSSANPGCKVSNSLSQWERVRVRAYADCSPLLILRVATRRETKGYFALDPHLALSQWEREKTVFAPICL